MDTIYGTNIHLQKKTNYKNATFLIKNFLSNKGAGERTKEEKKN